MSNAHHFDLSALTPQIKREGGTRADVRKDLFPALCGCSLSLLTLEMNGVRDPHWHSNASELGYCLEGHGVITIFGPHDSHDSFTIEAGEAVFIPRSYLHHIENCGSTPLKMLLCFDHENANSNELSNAFRESSPANLGSLFHQPTSFFAPICQAKEARSISLQSMPAPPPYATIPNRYKYNIDAKNPQIQNAGGWAKQLHKGMLPELANLALFVLSLNEKGLREPHWHPNATELNYCLKGKVRISIQFPSGELETYELSEGGVGLIPQGYLHHIENIGNDEARLAVFFTNASPTDIGLSGAIGAYPNAVLAAACEVSDNYFDDFPKYQQSLFIVPGGG